MKRPANRPTCKHGNEGTCRECSVETEAMKLLVKPLVDEFWDNRGNRDLEWLMVRACRMGMKEKDKARSENEPEGFCTLCSTPFESFEGMTQCPTCGTKGVPCATKDQVDVSINIHELRILCIWASNFAASVTDDDECNSEEVVYAIAARLRRQLPEKTMLTMVDELQALSKAGIEYETNHPAGNRAKLTDPE